MPQITATTDFETHRLWVNQPCERYTTATDEGAALSQPLGRSRRERQRHRHPDPSGLQSAKDRAICLANHGLKGDRPIVLQVAGCFGVGPIEQLYRGVLSSRTLSKSSSSPASTRLSAKEQLEIIEVPKHHLVKIIGFTDQDRRADGGG